MKNLKTEIKYFFWMFANKHHFKWWVFGLKFGLERLFTSRWWYDLLFPKIAFKESELRKRYSFSTDLNRKFDKYLMAHNGQDLPKELKERRDKLIKEEKDFSESPLGKEVDRILNNLM